MSFSLALGLFGGLASPSGLGISASGHSYGELGLAEPDETPLNEAGAYFSEAMKLKPYGSHRSTFTVPFRFPGSAYAPKGPGFNFPSAWGSTWPSVSRSFSQN